MVQIIRPAVPFFLDPHRMYAVEVWNDAGNAYIEISRHETFGLALTDFDALTTGDPAMRVIMRQRAQMFRDYVPMRLRE